MGNEELHGTKLFWKKTRRWPTTYVLRGNGSSRLRMESKSSMGVRFEANYDNRRLELKRRTIIPPLDVYVIDLQTGDEIGVVRYRWGFGEPISVALKNEIHLTMAPTNVKERLTMFSAWVSEGTSVITDDGGRVLSETSGRQKGLTAAGMFDAVSISQSDPDGMLLAAISWLVLLLAFQERRLGLWRNRQTP